MFEKIRKVKKDRVVLSYFLNNNNYQKGILHYL